MKTTTTKKKNQGKRPKVQIGANFFFFKEVAVLHPNYVWVKKMVILFVKRKIYIPLGYCTQYKTI